MCVDICYLSLTLSSGAAPPPGLPFPLRSVPTGLPSPEGLPGRAGGPCGVGLAHSRTVAARPGGRRPNATRAEAAEDVHLEKVHLASSDVDTDNVVPAFGIVRECAAQLDVSVLLYL